MIITFGMIAVSVLALLFILFCMFMEGILWTIFAIVFTFSFVGFIALIGYYSQVIIFTFP